MDFPFWGKIRRSRGVKCLRETPAHSTEKGGASRRGSNFSKNCWVIGEGRRGRAGETARHHFTKIAHPDADGSLRSRKKKLLEQKEISCRQIQERKKDDVRSLDWGRNALEGKKHAKNRGGGRDTPSTYSL